MAAASWPTAPATWLCHAKTWSNFHGQHPLCGLASSTLVAALVVAPGHAPKKPWLRLTWCDRQDGTRILPLFRGWSMLTAISRCSSSASISTSRSSSRCAELLSVVLPRLGAPTHVVLESARVLLRPRPADVGAHPGQVLHPPSRKNWQPCTQDHHRPDGRAVDHDT